MPQADWLFNAANAAIVRCSQQQPARGGGSQRVEADRLSLYIELNVAYRLTPSDADAVPQDERRVRRAGAALSGGPWGLLK
jgi:hypothetical protein